MDSAQNILSNAVLPFDFRKGSLVLGSAEYIAVEVLVSSIVRKFMKAPKSFRDLIFVHAISLPFLGGATGFMDPTGEYSASWATQFMDGAKGIPAVILAEWVLATFNKGFHFPWFGMRDLLITAGSKTISRPIASTIYNYLPKDAADALATFNLMVQSQNQKSSLHS